MSAKNKETSSSHEPANEPVNEEPHTESENGEEPAKKNKYDRGGKHPVVGLIIYCVLQFVALLFVVIATPIAMFKMNNEWRNKVYPQLASSSKQLCVSAWGMKLGCSQTGYYNRDFTHTFCYRVRVNFKVVEAFCIMTIGFMVLGLAMGLLSVMQKVTKGSAGAIGAFAMLLCIVPWSIIAGMYYQKPCCETTGWNTDNKVRNCQGNNTNIVNEDIPGFKTMGNYGPGFGLLVAAWALQVVGIVFAFAPL
ncbi:putative amastin [Leptomonas pyrrhocoris]|uniref:Putative amastin n=1 Tax=Leptomonas pyrrhocoris TaxID=157538 RepID=A0A0M9G143_LEPPY|nr:putative amastin [Leptomonas pyrrhocoris]XP_015658487.1 putative amastin [Leptomonas pyrrhocoris]KPA80047.1 putative amastin [Leptomonas pyrrhocoris]KPA80048.1 putative amastin [Leptomonas pyrrhocoris]|eukprot:XP_015658486.1 putative amastin [Leptomonas pyrrhocoris]